MLSPRKGQVPWHERGGAVLAVPFGVNGIDEREQEWNENEVDAWVFTIFLDCCVRAVGGSLAAKTRSRKEPQTAR